MNNREFENQIRYRLSNLNTKNEHHLFEDLCFKIVKAKIAGNIIPATGPVSAGGDQGKDFETYFTLIGQTWQSDVSKEVNSKILLKAAFACSLQNKPEKPKSISNSKIGKDLIKIVHNDPQINLVYFLSNQPINVARRHEIITWAKSEYNIKLEILDLEWLVEVLIQKDIRYLNSEYLHIPFELIPINIELVDAEYNNQRSSWQEGQLTITNFQNFYKVVELARYCTKTPELHKDIKFWLSILLNFIETETSHYKYIAIYEYLVISMRGFRSLDDLEYLVISYIDNFVKSSDYSEIENVSIILSYSLTYKIANPKFNINTEIFLNWINIFKDFVNTEESKNVSDTKKVKLLILQQQLLVLDSMISKKDPLNQYMNLWVEIISLLPSTPLIPLENWVRGMDIEGDLYDWVSTHPKYDNVISCLETEFYKRTGNNDIGLQMSKRAIDMFEKGDLKRSLSLFHQCKVIWFSHETLKGSILSLLSIGEIYHKLGLYYASKKYYLGALFIITNQDDTTLYYLISKCLLKLFNCEYCAGNYGNCLYLIEYIIKLDIQYSKIEDEFSDDSIGILIYHVALIIIFADQLSDELSLKIKSLINNTGYGEEIIEYYLDNSPNWGISEEETWNALETEIGSKPFSDLLENRQVCWKQSGITWQITWQNSIELNILAEGFISILQILLVEIDRNDWYLLPAKIEINTEFGDKFNENSFSQKNSSEPRKWEINLNRSAFEVGSNLVLYILLNIIKDISLLSSLNYQKSFESLCENGILNNIYFAHNYVDLNNNFYKNNNFSEYLKQNFSHELSKIENKTMKIKSLDHFPTKKSVVSEYNKEQSLKKIKKRVEVSLNGLHYTLELWRLDHNFKIFINKLRAKGYKDWLILSVLHQIVANYRLKYENPEINHTDPTFISKFKHILFRKENKNDIILPFNQISIHEFESQVFIFFSSVLASSEMFVGSNKAPIAISYLKRFIDLRFPFNKDDVEYRII
ncbi:MAG: hypothetical protein ACRCXZ_05610 [Patescibacteria group bacterium]